MGRSVHWWSCWGQQEAATCLSQSRQNPAESRADDCLEQPAVLRAAVGGGPVLAVISQNRGAVEYPTLEGTHEEHCPGAVHR